MKVEARYYQKENNHVQCQMCPHYCKIMPGKSGACRGRRNEEGRLWAINYGATTSLALDPIEKKPLYHFFPGTQILSIACNSCNMRCPFCQNWEISQAETETKEIPPSTLLKIYQEHNSLGIAYTYTEPLMWFEYLLDAGKLIREAGGKNVLVTNGLINEAPLLELLPLIDAMNIDLKSIDDQVYKKVLHGDLATVKRTIEIGHKQCHIEITNLLVTGLNDKPKDIDGLIDYVASIDKNIPLHFSRYFPNYEYSKPPTATKKIEYAYTKARGKLNYVYVGNVASDEGSNTYCPRCQNLLIERMYYRALVKGLDNGKCNKCGEEINIIK